MSRKLNRFFNDPSCVLAEPLDEIADLSEKGLSVTNAVVVASGLEFTAGSFVRIDGRAHVTRLYWYEGDHYAYNGTDTYKNGESGASEVITVSDTGFSSVTGIVADLLFFNRALSETEILNIFNGTTFDYNKSLVSYWELDEINPRDLVGSNDGTGVSIVEADIVPGYNGRQKGIDFDGTNDEIDMGNPDSLKLNDAPGFTLGVWLNSNDWNRLGSIVSKATSAAANTANSDYYLDSTTGGSGFLKFLVSDGVNFGQVFTATGDMKNNRWYHILVTWDGTTDADGLKLFRDNVLNSSAASTAIIADLQTTHDFKISNLTSARGFKGIIGSVRVFKTALTQLQIADLYAITRRI